MTLATATKMTKPELVKMLADLGYEIEESSARNYTNNLNPPDSWPARACYIVESDTKRGFANVDSRRDENFRKLQELRFNLEPLINGRIYEL